MDQNQSQNEKEKYNFDEDSSSFSPEIEEESNDEEEEVYNEPKIKEQSNLTQKENSSQLMDKLISIQKQMDTNQAKGKYSLSNYKENNNTDNKLNKNKNKININNNNNMNYFSNSGKNKDILNLDESESEENSNNNDHSPQKGNKYKQKQINNNKEYYSPNKNNINISQEPQTQKKEKGCELFIGNLNITTEKEDLNTLFSPFGEITDIRIHKNEENKKCYAFVRFSSKESATSALKLDSSLLNNRHIKVTKSNENATIFIGNIRKTWTKEELETKIRRIFHNINKIEFFTDP